MAEHEVQVADDGGGGSRKATRLLRAQWLRAAILGANDGLLSTTSLMLGIGAAKEDKYSMILSGVAGAIAGACSMAVGEFVSVATQRDIEKAASSRCRHKNDVQDAPGMRFSIRATPTSIKEESSICVTPPQNLHGGMPISEATEKVSPRVTLVTKSPPGMSPGRSPIIKIINEDRKKIAGILQEGDGEEEVRTNPYKAAVASGLAFLCGSFVPLASAIAFAHKVVRVVMIVVVATMALALFGGVGAYLGGSPLRISAARVLVGGWIAMAITYGLLKPFDSDDNKGAKDVD